MLNKLLIAACAFSLTLGLAYAESFSGTTRIFPDWSHTTTGLTTVKETFDSTLYQATHTSGTGANKMNQLWHGTVTIAASATNTIDITGGITNSFGTVLTMSKVRMVFFEAGSANVDTVTIGGGASAFSSIFADSSDAFVLRPDGAIFISGTDATAYAAGSGNIQFVNNNGNSNATVKVYLGASDS
jgi:hypothetical protein